MQTDIDLSKFSVSFRDIEEAIKAKQAKIKQEQFLIGDLLNGDEDMRSTALKILRDNFKDLEGGTLVSLSRFRSLFEKKKS